MTHEEITSKVVAKLREVHSKPHPDPNAALRQCIIDCTELLCFKLDDMLDGRDDLVETIAGTLKTMGMRGG